MKNRNEILELSFEFALEIIEYCEILEEKRKYIVARQLLKSGTSVGANVRESQNIHGRKDFAAKCGIAMREAYETEYWLLLCQKSKSYPDPGKLLNDNLSIKKLLSKIISSTLKNGRS